MIRRTVSCISAVTGLQTTSIPANEPNSAAVCRKSREFWFLGCFRGRWIYKLPYMNSPLRAGLAVALPFAVLILGSLLMLWASGRAVVTERLKSLPQADDRKPISQRLGGYDATAIGRQWSIFQPKDASDSTALEARQSEELFLKLDLAFPLLYGAGLWSSLLLLWSALGKPFSAAWLAFPVIVTVVSDWIENLVQIDQLHRFAEGGAGSLQNGWIQVASVATTMKWIFLLGTILFILVLAGYLVRISSSRG